MMRTRILVVEDETIVALDVRDRLTELGYEVAGVADRGDLALELVDAARPDLVLMDIRLKGEMDGIEAADQIKRRWFIPVVYLTAFSEENTLQRAKVTEPYGYIIKPFEDREIQSVIEMALYKHKAERRLRESERRYAATLASIGDGVIATDAAGALTFMNRVAEQLTGWPLNEAAGRPLADVFRVADEQTRRSMENPVVRVLKEGRSIGMSNHTILISRDGREIPIDDSAAPIIDDGGEITGAVLVYQDVTERRRQEAERQRILEQLAQAQKIESVGRLAGGVAHDFNNMLSVILGRVELGLLRVEPNEPIYTTLKEIQNAAQRSTELTRQLLAFARRQNISPKALDLNDTVAGMLKMLQRLIGEDIDLLWKPAAGLWPVLVDPSQIDQIMANLCINARDAIDGVGKLTIETAKVVFDEEYCALHPGFQCGQFAMLAVSDDGCGMDQEVIDHIFDPFFTTKEVSKGTGLGLATVYGIVKQNDGFINVYSELGKGSTFKIYLPRYIGEVIEETPAVITEMRRGRGETLLLVEDEAEILNVGKAMLEMLGYVVLTAGTPAEAIRQAKIHSGEIQLLITDVVMPEMNGRELARAIREITPSVKCLFTSGYTANMIAHRGVLEEGVHFLPKPFSSEELAARVREALEGK